LQKVNTTTLYFVKEKEGRMSENNNDNGTFTGKDTRPPGTWSTKNVRDVDGEEIPESFEGYRAGNPTENVISTSYKKADDGRILPVAQFVAESWTGIPTSQDRLHSCLNPFGHHEYRAVCLEIDGFATALGNVLCTECLEVNKKRQKLWIRILTLGIYNPEEF